MPDWLGNWISFNPSGSRWAVLAFGVGFALFFLGVCGMLPVNPKEHPKTARLFLGLGLFFLIGTVTLAGYWTVSGSKDTAASTSDTQRIEQRLSNVEQRLDDINGKLDLLVGK